MQITPAHSYRATLIPADVEAEDVESRARKGLLPSIRLKAGSAEQAQTGAFIVTGRPVYDVERVPEVYA